MKLQWGLIVSIIKNLELVHKKWKIYKNLETKRSLSFDAFSLTDLSDSKRTPHRFSQDNTSKNVSPALNERLAIKLNYLAVYILL
jgi:two-component system CheB/CheR fusion protein